MTSTPSSKVLQAYAQVVLDAVYYMRLYARLDAAWGPTPERTASRARMMHVAGEAISILASYGYITTVEKETEFLQDCAELVTQQSYQVDTLPDRLRELYPWLSES